MKVGFSLGLPWFLRLLFLAMGFIWLLLAALGEGSILLIEPGLASLATGALLLARVKGKLIRGLVAATGIYNLMICAYQSYAAIGLLQAGLMAFATASLLGYGLASLAFLSAIIAAYTRPQIFASHTNRKSGKGDDQG